MLERGTEAEAEHRGAPKAHPHAARLHHLLNSTAILVLHLSPCTRLWLSALTLLPRTGILMPCSLSSLSTLTSVGCSPCARQWGACYLRPLTASSLPPSEEAQLVKSTLTEADQPPECATCPWSQPPNKEQNQSVWRQSWIPRDPSDGPAP